MVSYQQNRQSNKFIFLIITIIVTIIVNTYGTVSAAAIQSNDNNDIQFDKRQPIPMPRIGRSSSSLSNGQDKRQSLIPAPRIGRRDEKLSGNGGRTTTIDCSNNPELCENYESFGSIVGNSGGGGGGGNINEQENLIEPLDIQLRAAFIPRLGKRSTSSMSTLHSKSPQSRIINENDLFDLYRTGIIDNGKMFGYLPRHTQQQSQLQSTTSNIDNNDDDNNGNDDTMLINDYYDVNNDQQHYRTIPAVMRDLFEQPQRQQSLSTLLNRYYWNSNKRTAIPYTPRIGRAVFAPRIGKKSAFVPRIG
ncbi:uncharacterized protein LOC124490379 [Dermatophagoides farinae]|uniref:uncharacterized protein LOC124490379 n=1 Tax=Dermatophagoides farinae TaxID=6954 RepID=UPI003F609CAE